MDKDRSPLPAHYVAALRQYLTHGREAILAEAYELGRAAIGNGLGVLDMAKVHGGALRNLFQPLLSSSDQARSLRTAETFFLESLSPFEATHRGFGEINAQLRQLIVSLEKRNQELGTINRQLAAEINERKRTEKALRESEHRYSRLIETANDVIFSLTPDGRFVALNRAFETVTGWRRATWLGRPFASLLHREDVEATLERFQGILRGLPPERWEYRVRKANGDYAVGEFTLTRENRDGRCVGLFGIARDVTERKRAAEALQGLSNKILQVQEEERKRISRELHDVVGQALTAISVNLATVRHNGLESGQLAGRIAGTQGLLQETMDQVHHFARELRPALLDELGLLPALRSHIQRFALRTGLRIRMRADSFAESLSDEQKIVLFRVAQESLTNVAKHAQAKRVKLSVRKVEGGICMEIADNGKSFREDARNSAKRRQRLGLLGMQERVRLVNGSFVIKPRLGKGTVVRVVVPVEGYGQRQNQEGARTERIT